MAQIVVVQTDKINPGAMGTSLWNTDAGRDIVLNRILASDLGGVRVEFVRFTCALDVGGSFRAIDIPFEVDIEDYVARGNRADVSQAPAQDWLGVLKNAVGAGNKRHSLWSGDVVGGCARFVSDFERRKEVDPQKVREWLDELKCPF